jgi:phosphate/sulfate permease
MQSAGADSVEWQVVREIVASWVLTVPFAALLAAGILNALKLLV